MFHYCRVMRNVTITLDEEVAHWARVEAAKRETSVSRLVGEMLGERMPPRMLTRRRGGSSSPSNPSLYAMMARPYPPARRPP